MSVKKFLFSDIASILKNSSAILVIFVLMIMPGFYAWFNISASWNPYGNTENIPIAVVNNDIGTQFGEKNINIGEKLVENLQENHNLGWNFVDSETAKNGVYNGKFYASIELDENFSKNLMSFLSDSPQKPQLVYTVNEKLNAIAPNITKKGAETIRENIETSFMSSMNEEIFKRMNLNAEKLQSYKNNIDKARNLINKLYKNTDKIHENLQKGNAHLEKGISAIDIVLQNIPQLQNALATIQDYTNDTIPVENMFSEMKNFIASQVKILDLMMTNGIMKASTVNAKIDDIAEKGIPLLQSSQEKLLRIQQILTQLQKILVSLNNFSKLKLLTPVIEKNSLLQNKITHYISVNRKAYLALQRGEKLSENILLELMNAGNAVQNTYASFTESLHANIEPALQDIVTEARDIKTTVFLTARELESLLPGAEQKIQNLQSALKKGNEKTENILEKWNDIEKAIGQIKILSDKMSNERIEEILTIMLLDPENEQNFFKHPVDLIINQLFPSPNYGSSIAPFFTVLALWVGALLCVSLLSVRSSLAEKSKTLRQGYLARLLFFMIIGFFQATIVVLGNLFFFKIFVVHPLLLWISSLLIITLFQIIVFSFVYLIGNGGKVLAILILLLQLSAGSGTFPVELTNNFFVAVHPYLPFTYAINLLREVSFGIVENIFYKNIFVLSFMLIASFSVGLWLSPYLSRLAIKMDQRTKGIDIFH